MKQEIKKVRKLIVAFQLLLVFSGITAFPLLTEVKWISSLSPFFPDFFNLWISKVLTALKAVDAQYPLLAYGTDWLAFAHIVIAVSFVGVLIDPVRNKWVVLNGMISCVLIWPTAFIAGSIRGIPFFWQLIDCSFGVLGFAHLYYCYRLILSIESNTNLNYQS